MSQANAALQGDPTTFEAICREAVACDHCFKRAFATRSFVDVAQPRYVGPRYWQEPQRRLFLFINPGEGHGSVEDREMRAALHAFQAGALPLETLFAGQRRHMPTWGRNGKFIKFFNAISVKIDTIALLNVAWCATKGDKYPTPMLNECWSRFTRRTIAALAPTQIVACGEKAQAVAQREQIIVTPIPHYAARGAIDYGSIRRLIGTSGTP